MKSIIFSKYVLILFISIQLWFVYISSQYPVIGVNVEQDAMGSWVVSSIAQRNVALQAGLQIGDVIERVNDGDPNQFASIMKWRTIDQAKDVHITRNDIPLLISFQVDRNFSDFDVLALTVSAIALVGSLLLLKNKQNSPSAKYLSLILLDMEGVFMALGASIRGDAMGKIMIFLLVMLVPILFLHFFVVFLKEKQDYLLPISFLKRMYTMIILGIILLSQLVYFVPTPITYPIFRFNLMFCITSVALIFSESS
ncbi:PDZ domain-containing protein [Paenibacillus agricola]|uniref:PDZ domain-containing protein n=1 Tax=Paenibacillus agricola TaxID=2716264 RepID=A0ABX0JHT5_9BACL|nr:PDZ domain-containing protein [Paenibacillus agricola]NHN33939.1 hypothetical protein [Paenibacillus agricola]